MRILSHYFDDPHKRKKTNNSNLLSNNIFKNRQYLQKPTIQHIVLNKI